MARMLKKINMIDGSIKNMQVIIHSSLSLQEMKKLELRCANCGKDDDGNSLEFLMVCRGEAYVNSNVSFPIMNVICAKCMQSKFYEYRGEVWWLGAKKKQDAPTVEKVEIAEEE